MVLLHRAARGADPPEKAATLELAPQSTTSFLVARAALVGAAPDTDKFSLPDRLARLAGLTLALAELADQAALGQPPELRAPRAQTVTSPVAWPVPLAARLAVQY